MSSKNAMLDLSPRELDLVRALLAAQVPGVEVRAFGSRVRGTARSYSDLDLVLLDDRPLTLPTMGTLLEAFQESDLPFRVDLVDWHRISESFREVIDEKYEIVQERGQREEATGQ
jgi:uncharacterized protein